MKRTIFFILFLLSTGAVSGQEITAYIFMAEECPICNYLGKTLKRVSENYKDEVNFVAVFPQRMSNIKSASLFKKKYSLTHFTVEIDKDQSITKRYDAHVTPEVVLVNSDGEILYRGAINDSYASPGRMRHGKVTEYFEDALSDVISGQKTPKPWPSPIGCFITRR